MFTASVEQLVRARKEKRSLSVTKKKERTFATSKNSSAKRFRSISSSRITSRTTDPFALLHPSSAAVAEDEMVEVAEIVVHKLAAVANGASTVAAVVRMDHALTDLVQKVPREPMDHVHKVPAVHVRKVPAVRVLREMTIVRRHEAAVHDRQAAVLLRAVGLRVVPFHVANLKPESKSLSSMKVISQGATGAGGATQNKKARLIFR